MCSSCGYSGGAQHAYVCILRKTMGLDLCVFILGELKICSEVCLLTHTSPLLLKPQKMFAVVSAAILSLLFDSQFSPSTAWRYIPGYGALFLHGLATLALDHTLGVVVPSLGQTFAMAATVFAASVVALPFYAFKSIVVSLFFCSLET